MQEFCSYEDTFQEMYFIKFFVTIFLFISEGNAIQCTLNGTTCTFFGVFTTSTNQLFKPSSVNNNLVETILFKQSTMHTLTKEMCEVFPNLKQLVVDFVSLEQIAPNALQKCKNLTNISFWINKLVEVDRHLFKENAQLGRVVFQNNKIKIIDGRMFENQLKLYELNIAQNQLIDFAMHGFPTLEKLETLYIHENDITDLDENELTNKFPNLKVIYMHNNLFDCNRPRIIINTLRRKNIQLLEFRKEKMTRNVNLSKIENIECTTDEERIINAMQSFTGFQSLKQDIYSHIKSVIDDETASRINETQILNQEIESLKDHQAATPHFALVIGLGIVSTIVAILSVIMGVMIYNMRRARYEDEFDDSPLSSPTNKKNSCHFDHLDQVPLEPFKSNVYQTEDENHYETPIYLETISTEKK